MKKIFILSLIFSLSSIMPLMAEKKLSDSQNQSVQLSRCNFFKGDFLGIDECGYIEEYIPLKRTLSNDTGFLTIRSNYLIKNAVLGKFIARNFPDFESMTKPHNIYKNSCSDSKGECNEEEMAAFRCKNFPKINFELVLYMLLNKEIKQGLYTPNYFQVNTNSGNYLVEEPFRVMWYLDNYNIAISGYDAFLKNDLKNKILVDNYKKICR